MELVLLRCLLLILLSCLLFSTAPASGKLVLDTKGNPVIRGYPYYIRAAQVRGEGNLGWVSVNGSCPLNVRLQDYPYGPPVMFFPEEKRRDTNIQFEEKLSIMFAAPTPCNAPTMWTLDEDMRFVTTGGVLVPSNETSYSRFRFGRYPFPGVDVYQFLFCPDPNPTVVCSTIGLIEYTHDQLLGRSTETMALRFIKMPEES